MITVQNTQSELEKQIGDFIWDFKIGDNILYNLEIIFRLIEDHNKGSLYCKPIGILSVSVIEAVLVDFISRLDTGTTHFPDKIDAVRRTQIKERLDNEKKVFESVFEGKTFKYRRLKNFQFSDLIKIYKDFYLLGKNDKTYELLDELCKFRNRVHIKNYFGNFEKNEKSVFTETRTQKSLDVMSSIIKYFQNNYPRPW